MVRRNLSDEEYAERARAAGWTEHKYGRGSYWTAPPIVVSLPKKRSMFSKKRKLPEWKCRTCGIPEADFRGPSDLDETICSLCCSWIQEEKDRRIQLARSIVGQVLTKTGHPFRETEIDYDQTWRIALNLANTDPCRKKRWDKEIVWDELSR